MPENYGDELRQELNKYKSQLRSEFTKAEKHKGGVGARLFESAVNKVRTLPAGALVKIRKVFERTQPAQISDVASAEPESPVDSAIDEVTTTHLNDQPVTSPVTKKSKRGPALVIAGLVVIVATVVGFARYGFVTVEKGIETTLGVSTDRNLFIEKSADASTDDLVVFTVPSVSADNEATRMVGTIFSKNDQTFAIFDGEVIWQIPLKNLIGKVLFAAATESI